MSNVWNRNDEYACRRPVNGHRNEIRYLPSDHVVRPKKISGGQTLEPQCVALSRLVYFHIGHIFRCKPHVFATITILFVVNSVFLSGLNSKFFSNHRYPCEYGWSWSVAYNFRQELSQCRFYSSFSFPVHAFLVILARSITASHFSEKGRVEW